MQVMYISALLAMLSLAVIYHFNKPVEMVTDPRNQETSLMLNVLNENGIKAKRKKIVQKYSTPNGKHTFNSYRVTVRNKDFVKAVNVVRNNTKGIVLDYADKRDYDR